MYLEISKEMLSEYILFQLTDHAGEVIDIGISPFRHLTAAIDFVNDKLFLSIIQTDKDKLKLANAALVMFPAMAERLAVIMGETNKTYGKMIFCVESGETFKSIAETARVHSLSYSALAKHLKGEKGYNSVKGRVYRKVRT